MPWWKRHLTAGHASQRQARRRQERNVLGLSIVRVHDIELFRRQTPAQAHERAEPERRQFKIFGCRVPGKRTTGGSYDQLPVIPPPEAARQ